MVERPFYPPTDRPTVEQLTADLSLLDITEHVKKDPAYKFAVGSGASADVFRAIYNVTNPETKEQYGLNVVVKILRGTPDESEIIKRKLNRELACWLGLKHPNVAELLGIAYFIPGKPPGLVSKWILRHDFLKFIGSHPDLKREKAKEIACGLQYLHTNSVMHGDLKVDNVIVSDRKEAQLTDFGIGRIQDVKGFTSVNRTPRNIRFTAPELMPINDDTSVIPPTPASDIFSLGMLLLQLFHSPDDNEQRRLPYNHIRFVAHYDAPLVNRIHAGDRPQRERYNFIEDQHWDIICKCWAGEPEKRPSVTEVHTSL